MAMKNPPHPGDFIRGDYRACRSHGDRSGAGAASFPARVVQSAERQGEPFRGHGTAHREGLRGENGCIDADAGVLPEGAAGGCS